MNVVCARIDGFDEGLHERDGMKYVAGQKVTQKKKRQIKQYWREWNWKGTVLHDSNPLVFFFLPPPSFTLTRSPPLDSNLNVHQHSNLHYHHKGSFGYFCSRLYGAAPRQQERQCWLLNIHLIFSKLTPKNKIEVRFSSATCLLSHRPPRKNVNYCYLQWYLEKF